MVPFSKLEDMGDSEKLEEDYDFSFEYVHIYTPTDLQVKMLRSYPNSLL